MEIQENENKKKNTIARFFIGVAILIVALFAFLIGSIVHTTRYKIHNVGLLTSPDGEHKLILQQIGDPVWPFGETHARVVLKKGDDIITKYKFNVYNDGSNISNNSWNVKWSDNYVDCIIYGEEQCDQLYHLLFNGIAEAKSLDTHYGSKVGYGKQEEEKEEETNPVDEDGYPLDEEWQSYKNEILKIADTIETNDDFDVKCNISAKGYPYAVIKQEIDETTGEKVEQHLVYNESYYDESKHEYVLEEYHYNLDGTEKDSAAIIDFYLIDCETLEVTDEHINTWH